MDAICENMKVESKEQQWSDVLIEIGHAQTLKKGDVQVATKEGPPISFSEMPWLPIISIKPHRSPSTGYATMCFC